MVSPAKYNQKILSGKNRLVFKKRSKVAERSKQEQEMLKTPSSQTLRNQFGKYLESQMPRKTSQINKNNRVLVKGCFFPTIVSVISRGPLSCSPFPGVTSSFSSVPCGKRGVRVHPILQIRKLSRGGSRLHLGACSMPEPGQNPGSLAYIYGHG